MLRSKDIKKYDMDGILLAIHNTVNKRIKLTNYQFSFNTKSVNKNLIELLVY